MVVGNRGGEYGLNDPVLDPGRSGPPSMPLMMDLQEAQKNVQKKRVSLSGRCSRFRGEGALTSQLEAPSSPASCCHKLESLQ